MQIVLALLSLIFGWTQQTWAQGIQPCVRDEQDGCHQIDVLVVQYDPSVPILVQLRNSQTASRHGAARAVFNLVKSGTVRLYEGCVPVQLLDWGVNTAVPVDTMSTWHRIPGSSLQRFQMQRGGVQPIPLNQVRPPVFPAGRSHGDLAAAYRLEVCNGAGSFQAPWAYRITAERNVYTLVCPFPEWTGQRAPVRVVYPNRDLNREAGLHFSTDAWRQTSQDWSPRPRSQSTHEYSLFVVVVEPRS